MTLARTRTCRRYHSEDNTGSCRSERLGPNRHTVDTVEADRATLMGLFLSPTDYDRNVLKYVQRRWGSLDARKSLTHFYLRNIWRDKHMLVSQCTTCIYWWKKDSSLQTTASIWGISEIKKKVFWIIMKVVHSELVHSIFPPLKTLGNLSIFFSSLEHL